MPRFRHFMAIDWSGAVGPRQKGIAVALCSTGGGPPGLLAPSGHRYWSRTDVLDLLRNRLPEDTLVGLDLGISLPFADADAFFPGLSASPRDARGLWRLIEETCAADPNLSASGFVDHPAFAPYFRRHGGREGQHFHHPDADHRRGRFRVTELAQARQGCKPYSNFNLVGAAQVGKSSLTGMRMLHRLGGCLPVWPIDTMTLPARGSVLVEIYTTLAAVAANRTAGRAKMTSYEALNAALAVLGSAAVHGQGIMDDHSSDALLTAAWLRNVSDCDELWLPRELSRDIALTEGWTFGAR